MRHTLYKLASAIAMTGLLVALGTGTLVVLSPACILIDRWIVPISNNRFREICATVEYAQIICAASCVWAILAALAAYALEKQFHAEQSSES